MFCLKRMIAVVFAAVLLTASCAMCQDAVPPPAQDAISPSADVVIKKIEVTGNFEVKDDQILAAVTSKVGDKLSTETLEQDLQRVFDLGFFSEDVKASLAEYEGGAKITFKVLENPVISDIKFDGNTEFKSDQLKEVLTTKKNTILNSNSLKDDIQAVEKKYHDAGNVAARVIDARIDPDKNLLISISEGIIQEIRVSYVVKDKDKEKDKEKGKDSEDSTQVLDTGKTKKYVILREMKTKPGEPYNTNKLNKDLQRIYNLGFFDDVHTKIDAGDSPGKIILTIEVEEGKTGSAGFGAGYSNNTGLTGFLTLSERNLKGKGRKIDTKFEVGGSRNDFDIGYFEPWLDNKQTSLEVNVYNTLRQNLDYGLPGLVDTDNYQEVRQGFNFTVGRPTSDYTRVFMGFRDEKINISPSTYDYLDSTTHSVSTSIQTDTRDFVYNPTSGRFDSATFEYTGGPVGGDYTYKKATFDLRRYYPVRKKQILCGRVKVELGQGDIPLFDYFDLGGVNSLRGYDDYQFAGTKSLLYNLEYRFLLSGNLSAVAFSDAGNTWMSMSDVKYLPGAGMHKSFGVGLRLKIPALGIGPVRLDYAITKDQNKIHFGFGHMF